MSTSVFETQIRHDPYERHDDMQPVLDEDAVARITRYGETRTVEAGEILFEIGDSQTEFILVLSGLVAIEVDGCDGTTTVVEHGRGGFTGEIDMFSNRKAVVRSVCREAGEIAYLGRDAFRRMLARNADLSETIIRAFILRRTGLIYTEQGDTILLGEDDLGETLALRSFLSRNGHPHKFVDPSDEPDFARRVMETFSLSKEDLPAVIWRMTEVLKRPSPHDVADLLGLSQPSCPRDVYDVAVIGVGPAGLAAAVNAAAEGMTVIAIEGTAPGGQAGTSSKIENYPAFPTGISGQALSSRMLLQAQKFGTDIITPRTVKAIACGARPYTLTLDDDQELHAHAIVIASGARWRKLGLDGEDRLENAGLYYGATPVEAALCEREEVVIVGGGNSSGQAAIFLSRKAHRVHILVRTENLAVSMSDYLIQRIEEAENIELHFCTEVIAVEGERHLEAMTWRDNKTGEEVEKDIRHLFVMIGAVPNTEWLDDCVLRDPKGFVLTGSDLPAAALVAREWDVPRMPYTGETSRPGLFAVGDVRSGSVKRVASAVGEGAISAQFLYKVVHEDD
ncbi:FAD-dependent oxidoreductase [Parvularcula dongshanensis]|uniref:Thioredoxin reductase n=1 Tax=Parvularcula dongshanensis TaxID=1173995 RepID=A0A840I556_9PROT|nr:cyclic nucleotide-binding domain-containing thioredoxin-disulfide reductase [Parvularcula dongshanensis]MBB4659334.1 thioredoxin reductase (NADPH) [Parvularcula dongshanensis]